MLIGEIARKTGFSRDTIRYYQKLGLIQQPGSAGHFNNYKDYPASVLKRLLAIRKIKAFGFTLKETQGILVLFEEGALEHERGNRYIERKIALIASKIKELEIIKSRLQEIVNPEIPPGACALSKILDDMVTN